MNLCATSEASETYTLAYGRWAEAATEVWKIAMGRLEGWQPTDEHFDVTMKMFDQRHEELKRAVAAM